MSVFGKVVTETLGTLAEEVAKKAPKRTTLKQVKTAKVKEAKLLDKVDELTGATNQNHTAQTLDTQPVEEFVGVRQDDINRARHYTSQRIEDTTNKIELETDEEKLAKLYEKKNDLYLKSDQLLKERKLSEDMMINKANDNQSGYESMYDMLSAQTGVGKAETNIESRTTALYNRFSSGMTELKEGLRTKFAGLSQNIDLAEDVIRYLKDGKVRNQATLDTVKKIAKQWTDTANSVKKLRNEAGGTIRDLEDWIMPQSHNKGNIRKAGYKHWRKTIISKLDVARITSEQGSDIESILTSAYKNIIAPEVEKGAGGTGANIAKRGQESRVLHFKTGDDLIAYNKEFGNSDVFATMDNHVRQQSNEIAMMQIMGANPEATYNKLKELARADGMGSVKEDKLDRLWRTVTGQVDGDNVVDNLDNFMLQTGSAYRALQIASKLGSATISSLADLGSIILGAGYRDLSSIKIMGRGLGTLLQEVTSMGKAADNILLANRIGVVSEFASASLANSRFAENAGTGFLQRASETVIRASGLGSYTNSLRASFGLELAANIAEHAGKKLDDVPFSNMLKEYGIDEAMWAKIGKTEKKNVKGAEFFDVTKLYGVDDELGYRVSEMMTNEMNAFVIMPGDRTRAWTTMGAKKGTFAGETARNLSLFKSFPISIVLMHAGRWGKLSGGGKLAYAGGAIVTNLALGTMTLWAYDIATGKTPRKANRQAMIGEALTKSGGLGIFGDFFIGMADTKYGSSFSDIILGVPASTIGDITKSAQDLMTKDTDEAVGNIYKRAKNYIPGQNLWYTRAVLERTIGNALGEAIDPKHQAKLRRQKKAMRLRGQELLFDN